MQDFEKQNFPSPEEIDGYIRDAQRLRAEMVRSNLRAAVNGSRATRAVNSRPSMLLRRRKAQLKAFGRAARRRASLFAFLRGHGTLSSADDGA